MFVNSIALALLLFNFCANNVGAQLSFDFMQSPIIDTVKFNNEYDFIIVGAGSGSKIISDLMFN